MRAQQPDGQKGFVFIILAVLGVTLLLVQGKNNGIFKRAELVCHNKLVETQYFGLEDVDKLASAEEAVRCKFAG